MISADFLQRIKLVDFSGAISYNENGFAVLPPYEIKNILASVQPASKSEIRFLPEGTHYADFIEILTDYPVDVDNSPDNLGDYFIYKNNVYKIYSSQNFQDFASFSTNHIETMVVRDNRIKYDQETNTINIPFPEIDSNFLPLFDLIKMVNFCFVGPSTMPVFWGFQQELRPNFPCAMVNIDEVINSEITSFKGLTQDSKAVENIERELVVSFHFYAYDKITAFTMLEKFKLLRSGFVFTTNKFICSNYNSRINEVVQELYENRTIFHGYCDLRFSFIVENISTETSNLIETLVATFNVRNQDDYKNSGP